MSDTDVVGEIGRCETHGEFRRVFVAGRWIGRCDNCIADERARRAESDRAIQRAQRLFSLTVAAAIPARFSGRGFADYRPRTPKQAAALEACRRYVADLETNVHAGTCLVLTGPVGVGKTHLLAAIVQAAVEQLVPARYATMADALAAFGGDWSRRGDERGPEFTRPHLLALDEVARPSWDSERAALVALVDARYRECRPTLLASNLTWRELNIELGERLADRLLENGGQVLALDGTSARGRQ
ncbi:MAG: ATP-binding protein [Pseudomonadota bacterium]